MPVNKVNFLTIFPVVYVYFEEKAIFKVFTFKNNLTSDILRR